MLTETLSGECPCCGYDKLLQRYGSSGHLQLDGCANCGFGYSTNHHDDDCFGVQAWLPYARHLLSCLSIGTEGLSDEEVRRMVFDWCEKEDRCDDVEGTIFVYSDEDIQNHKSLNLTVFKDERG